MSGPWGVYYRGVLAVQSITKNGAYAQAGKLILNRKWVAEDVQVREVR